FVLGIQLDNLAKVGFRLRKIAHALEDRRPAVERDEIVRIDFQSFAEASQGPARTGFVEHIRDTEALPNELSLLGRCRRIGQGGVTPELILYAGEVAGLRPQKHAFQLHGSRRAVIEFLAASQVFTRGVEDPRAAGGACRIKILLRGIRPNPGVQAAREMVPRLVHPMLTQGSLARVEVVHLPKIKSGGEKTTTSQPE